MSHILLRIFILFTNTCSNMSMLHHRIALLLSVTALLACVNASCLECCNTPGACSTAFNNAEGTCCGRDKDTPYCCPSNSKCVYNGPLAKVAYSCSAPMSSCAQCCQTGGAACQTAFNGQPGMCCGSSNSASFCCPSGGVAMCVKKPFAQQFSCRRTSLAHQRRQQALTYSTHQSGFSKFMSSLFTFFFLVAIVCCCCSLCSSIRHQQQFGNVAYQPVPGAPVAMYPAAGPGVGDGLLSGLLIGDLISRSHAQPVVNSNAMYQHNAAGFGPQEFAADSGGAFFDDNDFDAAH